jgi:toxin secretion/phage lysis holin
MNPMERIYTALQFALAITVAWVAGLHNAYKFLLALQILDVISGVIAAGKHRSLRSSIGRAGLRRKAHVWLLVLGLYLFQSLMSDILPQFDLAAGYGPAEMLATGFAFMEFLSIAENAHRAGVKLPSWITRWLATTQQTLGYDESSEQKGA